MLITLKYNLEINLELSDDLDKGQIEDIINEITDECICINKPETNDVYDCYGSTDYPLICIGTKEIKFLDFNTDN